jgi:hypothetical protein
MLIPIDKASQPPASDVILGASPWVVGEKYVLRDGLVDGPASSPSTARLLWDAPLGAERGAERSAEYAAQLRRDPRATTARVILDKTPDMRTRPARVWMPNAESKLVDQLVRLAVAPESEILAWVRQHGFVGVRARPREWFETVDEIHYACGRLAQAWGLATLLRTRSSASFLEPHDAALPTFVRGFRSDGPDLLEHASLVEAADVILPGALIELQGESRLSGAALAQAFGLKASPEQAAVPDVEARLQVSYLLLSALRDHVFEGQGLLRVGVDAVPDASGDAFRLQPLITAVGPLATAYLAVLDAVSWPAPVSRQGSAGRQLRWRAARPCLHCGAIYRPKRRAQKWCTSKCTTAAWHDRQRQAAQVLAPDAAPASAD